jgi:hypothetical protein
LQPRSTSAGKSFVLETGGRDYHLGTRTVTRESPAVPPAIMERKAV